MVRELLLWGLLSAMACGLMAAPVDRQAAKDVAAVFAQAAREHAAGRLETTPTADQLPDAVTAKTWSLRYGGMGCAELFAAETMETLVTRVTAMSNAGKRKTVDAYCRAAMGYLSSPQATERALACEWLAHFPASAIENGALPGIGALLDDRTAVFPGVRISLAQSAMASSGYTPVTVTVGEMAQIALSCLTQGDFHSRASFERWWAENGEYGDHLWYWVACSRETANLQPRLATLAPKQALKVYLLLDNSTARQHEMPAPEPNAEGLPGEAIYFHPSINPTQVGAFVAKHHLQPVLFDLLAGTTTWPEVQDNTGWGETALGLAIAGVGPYCWTRADAATIERILQSGHGLPVRDLRVQTALALTAARLDNARLAPILLGQLAREPRQAKLATLLLAETGLAHWDVIHGCYTQCDGDGQRQVINALRDMTNRAEARGALCQLFAEDHLEAVMTPDGKVDDADAPRRARLAAYTDAAQLWHGGPVVDPEVLQTALAYGLGKIDPQTAAAQRAAMPAARTAAIAQLAAFFAPGQ